VFSVFSLFGPWLRRPHLTNELSQRLSWNITKTA